jgi:hypothetical protein
MPHPHAHFEYDFEGEPFTHCKLCEKDLRSTDEPYFVEKALKPGDVIFEYAMCMACVEDMRSAWSAHSVQAMEQFFGTHEGFRQYVQRRNAGAPPDLEHCAFTGKPVAAMREYQIVAAFRLGMMVEEIFPYAIGEETLEEIQSLLSKETLGNLDDLGEKLFDWPPDLQGLKPRPIPIF